MLRGILAFLVYFGVVPLLATIAVAGELLLPGREATAWSGRIWSHAMLLVGGVKLKIAGESIWRETAPAVVVANHTSAYDIFVMMASLPSPYRFVAKKELFQIPLLGWAMRLAGHVPIERSGTAKDVRALDPLAAALAINARFIFFPEGTRTEDGRLSDFKGGAFHFAARHQLPVIPVAICGAQHVQRYPSKRIRPGLIELKVLAPIDPTGRDRVALKQAAFAAIAAALPADQKPVDEPAPAPLRS